MNPTKHSDQGHNTEIDKTDAYASSGVYTNQGGGKLGSGTQNSGHPANNAIQSEQRHDANPDATSAPQPGDLAPAPSSGLGSGHEAGTKGSGNPVLSGAGRLLDDRPGRNEAKDNR